MSEIPNRNQEELQQPQPQTLFDPTETKVVHEVPVEQLIPDIKPTKDMVRQEGIDYRTNSFSDSFIHGFFSREMAQIINGKEYEDFPFKQDLDILREKMAGQTVVDLGSDKSWSGYCLASLLGAKAYIGIDLFEKGQLEGTTEDELRRSIIKRFPKSGVIGSGNSIESKIDNHIKPRAIPASIIQGDMLEFLQRLPDNSVSIFTFGISAEIIGRTYNEELGKEISRVLDPSGGHLKLESSIPVPGSKNLFKELFDKQFTKSADFVVSSALSDGNPGFFVKE